MVVGMRMKVRIRMRTRMRMCGHCEKARVIQPDGQVRQVELPVSVGDLLRLHPHHYVRDATNRRIKCKASIMPMEAELESGGIYLLLPLPRLFPSSSFCAPSLPPPCACFLRDKQDQEQEEDEAGRRTKCGPSIWMGKRRQCGLLFFTSCIAQSCKVSPEGVGLGLGLGLTGSIPGGVMKRLGLTGSIPGGVMKRSRIWEPSLEKILENDIFYPKSSSGKDGEGKLVQERKRIEHQVPKPSSSSSKPNPMSCSSSFCNLIILTKKRDADANVIIL